MSNRPLVSIGIPVFNCRHTLALALRSIIGQTYRNWELILIDDGSTDQTVSVAREFEDSRITVLADGQRLGLAARLNQVIDLSRGQYFARMDGDDLCYPQRLEKQVTYLEAHPEIDLAGTAIMVFTENGRILGKRAGPQTHAAICRRPTGGFRMFHPTYMGRLAWFRSHRYDVRVVVSQDQDLLLRTYRHSRFANIPEILLGYREPQLQLHKIFRSRWFFIGAALRQFRQERGLLMAPLVIIEQGLKAALDILAIGTGLNYYLLPQRARQSYTDLEAQTWQQVWSALHQDLVET